MPKYFSKTKGRVKLAYRTPDSFRRKLKYKRKKILGELFKVHREKSK